MSFNSSLEKPALYSSTNQDLSPCLGSTDFMSIDSQTPCSASTYQQQQQQQQQQPEQHPSRLDQYQFQRQELQSICTTPLVDTDNDLMTSTPTTINDLISSETAVTETTLSSRGLLLDTTNKYNDYNNDNTFTKEATAMIMDPFSRGGGGLGQGDSTLFNPSSPSLDESSTWADQQQQEEQEEEGRHPQKLQGSWYTWLFSLEKPETRSSVIVGSSCLPTGGLLAVRMVMFMYTFTVLLTDICKTERPKFEFCFLTQLSYLGLTSYLGTVSWHTFNEWRYQRAYRRDHRAVDSLAQAEAQSQQKSKKTSLERQHWLLTDMNFFLYQTICTFHVIVPLLYWGYLGYEGDAKGMAIELKPDALWRNYSFHGGDLIVILIEIAFNTMPIIPSHIMIVYFICLLYLGEAHLVYHLSGEWTYLFLDTTQGPIWVALYFGVGVVILCAFCFMYYLHRSKNWVRARFTRMHRVVHLQVQGGNIIESTLEKQTNAPPTTTTTTTPKPSLQVPAQVYHLYRHRHISDLLTRNRKRSDSHGSEESTASTLVGDLEETKVQSFP